MIDSNASNFSDIKIVAVDQDLTQNPDPSEKMYNIYLKLSADPPAEWAELFNEVRRFPRNSGWRRAWIEGQYIVIYCPLEELKTKHLPDLKEDVKIANQNYRAFLIRQGRHLEKDQQQEDDEEKRKNDELGDLDFEE